MDALLAGLSALRVIDLSQPMQNGMPQSPGHPPFRMALERRHGDMVRPGGASLATELLITGGHVGTHVDALAHRSQDGILFGGGNAAENQSHKGMAELGIDSFKPFVGRGLVLDVAAVHGVEILPPGYEITCADLDAALEATGTDTQVGDALLIGTGWSRLWGEGAAFLGSADGVPGPGGAAGTWLAERGPSLVGGETLGFEHVPAGDAHAPHPVHRIMLSEFGINIVETMRLFPLLDEAVHEFVLVMNPLNIVGATGAPVRPLALIG